MSNAYDKYLSEWMKVAETEWFKDHVAAVQIADDPTSKLRLQIVDWRNTSGSSTYFVRYILQGPWLIVVGDLGEAVFQWSEVISPKFLAGLNFHYWLGKCQASDEGRKPVHFDRAQGMRELKEWFDGENEGDYSTESWNAISSFVENSPAHDKYELQSEVSDAIYDTTGDAELCSMIHGFFFPPTTQIIGTFVGMQMAMKQIMPKG